MRRWGEVGPAGRRTEKGHPSAAIFTGELLLRMRTPQGFRASPAAVGRGNELGGTEQLLGLSGRRRETRCEGRVYINICAALWACGGIRACLGVVWVGRAVWRLRMFQSGSKHIWDYWGICAFSGA